jgi:hypothetical protein
MIDPMVLKMVGIVVFVVVAGYFVYKYFTGDSLAVQASAPKPVEKGKEDACKDGKSVEEASEGQGNEQGKSRGVRVRDNEKDRMEAQHSEKGKE